MFVVRMMGLVSYRRFTIWKRMSAAALS